jgi:hypothetical protein
MRNNVYPYLTGFKNLSGIKQKSGTVITVPFFSFLYFKL